MKTTNRIILAFLFGFPILLMGQETDGMASYNRGWQLGISFGEIPIMHGSFKPGIRVGYQFNDFLYVGGIYQITDHISRNDDSFDAQSTGLDGLVSSNEAVAPRAILHARIRPHRYAPFVSLGFVYNGNDTETIQYDDRPRTIGESIYEGKATFQYTRPSAFRPAIGFGYQYTFKNRMTVSTEWTFDFFNPVPKPEIDLQADFQLTESDRTQLFESIKQEFTNNFHNRYHIFHIGLGYQFK